jgi:hypothetical protein
VTAISSTLVRTQKFSEKAKAPPTLIENRELGLFFMEEQLLCDQWSNGGFAGRQLLDIATQRKPTQVFSAIFSVEIGARADGALFGQCYKQWIKPDPAVPTYV